MEKKLKIFIAIGVILYFLFAGKSFQNGNTYQDMLFTTKGKIDKGNNEIGGFTFKFGGEIDDIR